MPRKVKTVAHPTITPDSPKLTTPEAATYTGFKASTLDNWRCTGRVKIPFLKIGGRIFYLKSDLDAFLESCRVGA